MTKRHPAWFTMLLVALYGDISESEEAKRLSDFVATNRLPLTGATREKLADMFRVSIEEWQEKIPDTALWSIANEDWNPGPVLQEFNHFCMTRGWIPHWDDEADKLTVGDRTYGLPEETVATVLKKKKRKARLAAMALVDYDSILSPDWLATPLVTS